MGVVGPHMFSQLKYEDWVEYFRSSVEDGIEEGLRVPSEYMHGELLYHLVMYGRKIPRGVCLIFVLITRSHHENKMV